jgi:hypothetical protein
MKCRLRSRIVVRPARELMAREIGFDRGLCEMALEKVLPLGCAALQKPEINPDPDFSKES